MAGDPQLASIWADADVYVGPTDAPNPADVDTEFSGAWDLAGLLNGENGFAYSHEEEEDDHYAWGGIIVRTSRRNFKQLVTWTALEDNDVIRDLLWPGSPPGKLVVPRPKRIKIAFETREGDKVKRLISAYQAEVAHPEFTDNESALTEYELPTTIFPDVTTSPATLFIVQETGGVESS